MKKKSVSIRNPLILIFISSHLTATNLKLLTFFLLKLTTLTRRFYSSDKIFEERSKISKFQPFNRGNKYHTVQSANDKIITIERKTPLQYKEKTDKSRVPLFITYHPALNNRNNILRNNLPILYINERMADLFKDPPMTAFKRPKNFKVMVVRARIDNLLPNGGLKHVQLPDTSCASTALTRTFLKAPSHHGSYLQDSWQHALPHRQLYTSQKAKFSLSSKNTLVT